MPEIALPLLMMAVTGTLTFEFEVTLPLLARDTFHGTATTYSWLIEARRLSGASPHRRAGVDCN